MLLLRHLNSLIFLVRTSHIIINFYSFFTNQIEIEETLMLVFCFLGWPDVMRVTEVHDLYSIICHIHGVSTRIGLHSLETGSL